MERFDGSIDSQGSVGVTFLEAFFQNAARFPDRSAFVSRTGRLTYCELVKQSGALATAIVELVGSGNEPLVVFGHKSPLMLVCMIACVRSGHAYVPVDPSTPRARVSDILGQTDSPLVFAVDQLELDDAPLAPAHDSDASTISSSPRRVLDSSAITRIIAERVGQSPDAAIAVTDRDTFYIIFTSGSTGTPKGVEISASCLDHFFAWPLSLIGTTFDSEEPKTYLNQALFAFDLSVYELAMSLSSGGTLVCADRELLTDLRAFFAFLAQAHTQVWSVTPSFLEMCLADRAFSSSLLPDLQTVLACGETFPAPVARKFLERFPDVNLYNTYGPTESTVAVTAVRITPEMATSKLPLPVGFPKPGTSISTIDPTIPSESFSAAGHRKHLPSLEQGEILISGTTVAKGYYRRDDLTRERFATGIAADNTRVFRTGDIGFLDDEGCLHCLGRADGQVKLNGFRIELGDIENNLNALPDIRDAVVLCVRHDGKPHHLVGFVCPDSTAGIPKDRQAVHARSQAIKQQLETRLPHYMVPRRIVFLDHLPLNCNGKIDRKALAASLERTKR